MEKTEIIEQVKKMKTAKDLASLLDGIKQDVFGSVRYGISENMLKHFASDSIAPKRFRTFHIHKKSGGLREIKAPCRQLDVILTCVNEMLKAVYRPSDAAMGFTSGRSVLDNAQVHVGHNYVFNIDLKDFFPSIPQARVWKRLQLPPFNFMQEVANVLAGLCCSFDKTANANVLPQGSPASPLLTNAICDKLDRRMNGVAKRFGLHYSRYADDMTFSSMHNVYQEGGAFRTEIQRIISEQGFRMNESKTRIRKADKRQEVTGLTVNAIANVSRKYISDLRWILHVWEKEGYAKAYALFYPKYKKEKGHIKKGEPVMENVIGGKLNYLRMVRGSGNLAYQKLAARYDALQQLVFVDKETDKAKSYVYVQPYKLSVFQELFHTEIRLEISREKKVIGRCEIAGKEKYLAISKSTQKILCPDIANKESGDPVSSDELGQCFVTLCQSKGKNFWLITKFEPKRSHCLSIQNLKFNPDELLSLWEKNGFEYVADELTLFIQYGRPEESIIYGNPLTGSDDPHIDRGAIKSGKEYLLSYFLKHKHLTSSQKKRFTKLLMPILTTADSQSTKEVEELLPIWEKEGLDAAVKAWKELSKNIQSYEGKGKAEVKGSDIERIRLKHHPDITAEFLSLFGSPDGLKFLTHDFDPDSGMTMENVIKQVENILGSEKYKYQLPKSLFGLINGFINGSKWIDYDGAEHFTYLKSDEMRLWMNKYRTLHPISSNEFGFEIQKFRNTIRLSKPRLPQIVSDLISRKSSLRNLNLIPNNLDKADFYTNVYILKSRIFESVLSDMSQRNCTLPVRIKYTRSAWNEYRLHEIRFTHIGSEANPFDEVKAKFMTQGGALFALLKICLGYCDWTIEANFEGEYKRWRILNCRNLPEVEDIEAGETDGFSHIFTFFKYR